MALTAEEQEYARLVASGKVTQIVAYSQCYDVSALKPETIRKRASALARRPDIVEQIAVLTQGATAAAIKAAAYTIDCAMEDANRIMTLAEKNGQTSAAVAAAKLKAQLAGHVLDRKEIKEADPLKGATTEELGKLRDEITRRLLTAKEVEELTDARTEVVRKAA